MLNEKWINRNFHTVFFHALCRQYSSNQCDDLFFNSEWKKMQMNSFIDLYDLFTEILAVLTLSTESNCII